MTIHIDYKTIPKHDVPCACCGSTDVLVARTGDRFKFGLRTVVCKRCGLIFTSPRPSEAWFDEFYRLHYRKYYESIDQPDEAYLNRDWIRGRQLRNIDVLAPHLAPAGKLLDIGSAEGSFLYYFKQRFPNWTTYGIDPSESFSAFAREHFHLDNISTGSINDLASWDAEQFDLITAGHVVEHLLDPNQFFSTCRRLLKPNGQVFIDVPDTDAGARGIENIHIGHVYHFTQPSMKNFLEKFGFRVIVSQRDSTPNPWTMLVLAEKQPSMPDHWAPPPVDSAAIKQRFVIHTSRTVKSKLYILYRHYFPKKKKAAVS